MREGSVPSPPLQPLEFTRRPDTGMLSVFERHQDAQTRKQSVNPLPRQEREHCTPTGIRHLRGLSLGLPQFKLTEQNASAGVSLLLPRS